MDPWRKSVMQAIMLMNFKCDLLEACINCNHDSHKQGVMLLHNAIRHLAYPDRDVYPKVRYGSKKHPVTKR